MDQRGSLKKAIGFLVKVLLRETRDNLGQFDGRDRRRFGDLL